MPNFAIALRAEIARLARKELRNETQALAKAASAHRLEIAALKRRVGELEKRLRRSDRKTPAPVQHGDEDRLRFRPDGFAKHRQRLGLSAAAAGRLLGVSALSVYHWETGKAKPRRSHLPAIATLRAMGKREAARRLEEIDAGG